MHKYSRINGLTPVTIMQVLDDAAAVDAKYEAGESILPLCGLPVAVKDSIDVVRFLPVCSLFAF